MAFGYQNLSSYRLLLSRWRPCRTYRHAIPEMTFAAQLKPHADRLGSARVADLCGVSVRSIQLWLKGQREPNRATVAGVLGILKGAK